MPSELSSPSVPAAEDSDGSGAAFFLAGGAGFAAVFLAAAELVATFLVGRVKASSSSSDGCRVAEVSLSLIRDSVVHLRGRPWAWLLPLARLPWVWAMQPWLSASPLPS